MSEPANTPAEPSPSTQCGDNEVWDETLQACVPKADQDVAGAGAAASAEKGMFAAVKAVMQDALNEMRKEIMNSAKTIMNEELAKIQKEFAVGLRKELGLSKDPTVTKSELEGAIRKAVLDLKTTEKRTPQSPPIQKSTESTVERSGDLFKGYGGN